MSVKGGPPAHERGVLGHWGFLSWDGLQGPSLCGKAWRALGRCRRLNPKQDGPELLSLTQSCQTSAASEKSPSSVVTPKRESAKECFHLLFRSDSPPSIVTRPPGQKRLLEKITNLAFIERNDSPAIQAGFWWRGVFGSSSE